MSNDNKIYSYKDLIVWQKSILLCERLYIITRLFPKHELYSLISQIRRCCVSIPSNIAEGKLRGHKTEYIQFLRIAFGSGAELETQLLIAFKIGYIRDGDYKELINMLDEIMRMLNALITSLSRS
jgi:four helix bundle protein